LTPTPNRAPDARLVLFMLALTAIWGLNALATKVITNGMTPAMAAAMRGAVALVFLAGYGLARRQPPRAPARVYGLAVISGLMLAADFLLFFSGARLTTGGQLSIFINTAPLFVAVGAHFLLRGERLHTAKALGLLLSCLGIVALFSADLLPPGEGHWRGNLLVLGSSLAWGASTLFVKRFLADRIDTFQLHSIRILVSTPLLLLVSLGFESDPFFAVTARTWAMLIFQGTVTVGFSYLMWLALLKRYPASAVQALTVLSPVWAVALGMALLDERLTPAMLLGMVLVGLGLLLVGRPGPRPAPAKPAAG
jgi:drug/metabolite transporter (DMT)-like permease